MEQIRLMSKFGLAVMIAITAISVAVATHAYNIQTADAQARLPNNSVSSQTIVNGQVQTVDLANNAVTTAKIADGAITSEKLAEGVGGGDIELSIQRVTDEIQIPPNTESAVSVDCPTGTILTGGGFDHFGAQSNIQVTQSIPVDENTWQVFGVNKSTTGAFFLGAYALCVGPTIP